MPIFVTDTHPLLWALGDDPSLSSAARQVFLEAERGQHLILVPAIVLVEIIYAGEKGRIPAPLVEDALNIFSPQRRYPCRFHPLFYSSVIAMRSISRNAIPDLPDRLIAATALDAGCPLITADGRIHEAVRRNLVNLQIVW